MHRRAASLLRGEVDAWPTIQGGLNAASEGDMVLVDDGEYIEDYITWPLVSSIHLKSRNGKEAVTLISPIVIRDIGGGEGATFTIEGLTVEGLRETLYMEGGIGVYNSSGSILNCEIHNFSFAGIMASESGQLNIIGNEIHDNGGNEGLGRDFGIGISAIDVKATVNNNRIYNQSVYGAALGSMAMIPGEPSLVEVDFVNNEVFGNMVGVGILGMADFTVAANEFYENYKYVDNGTGTLVPLGYGVFVSGGGVCLGEGPKGTYVTIGFTMLAQTAASVLQWKSRTGRSLSKAMCFTTKAPSFTAL